MDQQIMYSFSANELLNELREIVREEIRDAANRKPKAKEPDVLITRQETAAILGISLPTLNVYTKKKKVIPYKIGSRVRYKKNEVLEACEEIENYGEGYWNHKKIDNANISER